MVDPQGYEEGRDQLRQGLAKNDRDALAAAEAGYYLDVLQGRLRQTGDRNIAVTRRGERIVIGLPARLIFESDGAQLSQSGKKILATLAKVLVEYRMTTLAVEGHTGNIGAEAANLQQSEQRALAVARHLIEGGVANKRLLVVGLGPLRPAASNTTPTGRERNRRIELRLEPVIRANGR